MNSAATKQKPFTSKTSASSIKDADDELLIESSYIPRQVSSSQSSSMTSAATSARSIKDADDELLIASSYKQRKAFSSQSSSIPSATSLRLACL
jgi:hypothetical protein